MGMEGDCCDMSTYGNRDKLLRVREIEKDLPCKKYVSGLHMVARNLEERKVNINCNHVFNDGNAMMM